MYELGYWSLLLLLCEKKLTTFSKDNIRCEYDVFSSILLYCYFYLIRKKFFMSTTVMLGLKTELIRVDKFKFSG